MYVRCVFSCSRGSEANGWSLQCFNILWEDAERIIIGSRCNDAIEISLRSRAWGSCPSNRFAALPAAANNKSLRLPQALEQGQTVLLASQPLTTRSASLLRNRITPNQLTTARFVPPSPKSRDPKPATTSRFTTP